MTTAQTESTLDGPDCGRWQGINMNPVAETVALLTLLVRAMVKDRDAVKVTTVSGGKDSTAFVLEVAQRDRGKVLGKHGKMAQSLRFIVRSIGKENGLSFLLDVPEAVAKASSSPSENGAPDRLRQAVFPDQQARPQQDGQRPN